MSILRRMIAGIVFASFIMTVSALPSVAFAEATEEVPAVMSAEDALLVEKLEALGVIDITPEIVETTLTRREMAELVCRYVNLPEMNTNTTAFADVSADDPSIGAIMALYKTKIVSGDGVNFHPDDNISYVDAIAMVVNALGYKPMVVTTGGYPAGYLNIATKIGLLASVKVPAIDAEITLRDVLKLFEAGLSVEAVVFDYYSEGNGANYGVLEGTDFLSSLYRIDTYEGIVTGNEHTTLSGEEIDLTDEQIEIDYVEYDTPGYIYASFLGKSVKYYLRRSDNGTKEIAYIEENGKYNNEITINAEDLVPGKSTNTTIYYEDENGKENRLSVSNAPYVIYNGKTYGGYGNIKNILPSTGFIRGLDNNKDKVCDVLFVNEYYNIVPESIDAYSSVVTAKYTGTKLDLSTDTNDVVLYIPAENRYLKDVNDLEVGDVLSVMVSNGTEKLITVYVSRDIVSGEVEMMSSTSGAYIDGAYYKQADGCTGEAVALGLVADFCLDFNGKIADVRISTELDSDEKYAVLTGVEVKTADFDQSVRLRMFTQDAEVLTVNARDRLRIGDTTYSLSNTAERNSALSRIYAAGNGVSSITDAYVVRFEMVGGEVSYLDIGDTGKEGRVNVIGGADKAVEMLVRKTAGVLRLRTPAEGNNNVFVYADYDSSTLIFAIPDDLSKTNDYGMVKQLEEAHYTDAWATGSAKRQTTSVALYGRGGADGSFAEVVLLRGRDSKNPLDSASSELYVYDSMGATMDKEGMARSMMILSNDTSVLLADGMESDPRVTGLEKGDIIQFGTDSSGYANDIAVIATVDDGVTYDARTKYFGAERLLLGAGTVASVDSKKGEMLVELTDKVSGIVDGSKVLIKVSCDVQCYRKDYDEITTGDITSLAKGDVVVFTVTDYYKATSVVAIK